MQDGSHGALIPRGIAIGKHSDQDVREKIIMIIERGERTDCAAKGTDLFSFCGVERASSETRIGKCRERHDSGEMPN